MISHCANQECGAPFHYLRGGRLYRFEVHSQGGAGHEIPNAIIRLKPARATVYFWLCQECSATHSLKFSASRGLVLGRLVNGERPARNAPVVIDGELESTEQKILTCPHCRPEAVHQN